MLEGTLPLTEDNFKSFTTNEMERGLLETLMATSDSSTLKRNKVKFASAHSGPENLKNFWQKKTHELK